MEWGGAGVVERWDVSAVAGTQGHRLLTLAGDPLKMPRRSPSLSCP